MNSLELCKEICNLHPSIMGTGVVDKGKLVGMFARPGTPVPNEKQFERLLFQTQVISSITKTNIDFFGQSRHFSLYFEHSDLYFFHLSRFGGKGVLVVQITQPYDHEEIVSKINEHLGQNV